MRYYLIISAVGNHVEVESALQLDLLWESGKASIRKWYLRDELVWSREREIHVGRGGGKHEIFEDRKASGLKREEIQLEFSKKNGAHSDAAIEDSLIKELFTMVSEWLREISKIRTILKNENLHLCLYLLEKTATGKRHLIVAVAVRKCSQSEAMQHGEIQGNKYCTAISSHFPISSLSLVKWTVKSDPEGALWCSP